MSWKYLKEQNELREQPAFGKPDEILYSSSSLWMLERDYKEWEKHVASLRTLPCHPSCKELWEDEQIVEEGKDFTLAYKATIDGEVMYFRGSHGSNKQTAIPITPIIQDNEEWHPQYYPKSTEVKEDEDEYDIWNELYCGISVMANEWDNQYTLPHWYKPEIINKFRKKYSLTRKDK